MATYLYCVVRMVVRPKVGRVPAGLAGATRPSVVAAGKSLWLVVADVPLDVYGPEPLETALRNLTWVSEVAVAHESVIEHFARMRGATVIPMKLFTMFSNVDRAVDEIASNRRDVESVAKRIAGSEEWGVRVTRSADRRPSSARTGSLPGGGRPSGAEFLKAKKQVRDDVRRAVAAAAAAAEDVFDALAPLARDARRRTDVPAGAVSPPLLDAAFLVASGRRTRFRTVARRAAAACSRAGAEMTLTGPWPAYNFVRPEERA